MNFNGAIATTRIGFNVEGKSDASENWAVLDGGHTLSPYSEIFQGKATRRWVERLASMQKLGLQFNPGADQASMQPTFDTVDLSEALSSVGCSY
ncbi:MAG TPA: hypothetical protein VGR96_16715 [Acidobacteriaceae bacterium]|nr:hypothetical protein [Acidobacteriaceae bacterium]